MPSTFLLLLADDALPPPDVIEEAWERLFPDEPVPPIDLDEDEGALHAQIGEFTFVATMEEGPFADLAGCDRRNPLFTRASQHLKHRAHLVLSVTGPGKAAALDRLATRLAAALADATGALGVIVAHSSLPWPGSVFVQRASDAGDETPYDLWVALPHGRKGERFHLVSEGMERYGTQDLWIEAPVSGIEDAVDFALSLIGWFATETPTLTDGETVGRNADERVPVRKTEAPFGPERPVWAVRL